MLSLYISEYGGRLRQSRDLGKLKWSLRSVDIRITQIDVYFEFKVSRVRASLDFPFPLRTILLQRSIDYWL